MPVGKFYRETGMLLLQRGGVILQRDDGGRWRHYRYASGLEGDMCRVGFSPRSANLVLYVGGFPEFEELLGRFGKYKRSKACLYVTKLADVDLGVLEEIVRRTFQATEDADQCAVC